MYGCATRDVLYNGTRETVQVYHVYFFHMHVIVYWFLFCFNRNTCSLPRHQTRSLYFGYDFANVQNTGIERFDNRVRAVGVVHRWNKIQ